MPWVTKVCKCKHPNTEECSREDVGPGSIWECPVCQKKWVYTPGVIMFGSSFTEYKPEDEWEPDIPELSEDQVRNMADLNQ